MGVARSVFCLFVEVGMASIKMTASDMVKIADILVVHFSCCKLLGIVSIQKDFPSLMSMSCLQVLVILTLAGAPVFCFLGFRFFAMASVEIKAISVKTTIEANERCIVGTSEFFDLRRFASTQCRSRSPPIGRRNHPCP